MKKQFYVTNTETSYRDGEVYIDLFGRTEDKEREWARVTGFEPYFFVHKQIGESLDPTAHDDIVDVDVDVDEESLC